MQQDYQRLLDADMREFIRQTEAHYPADAINASIADQRRFYDDLCEAYAGEIPPAVEWTDSFYPSRAEMIPVRHYTVKDGNPAAHLLFFHGGGFVVGGLHSHHSICAELCVRSGCDLTAVDYRLAPEHVHPASFEDCRVAFMRLRGETGLPIILIGDSAGGNLAAALAHSLRGEAGYPVGQVLIYPALGHDMTTPAFSEHAEAPLLTAADCEFYHQVRSGGNRIDQDPTAFPLADDDFTGLPPTVAISADCDPLRDDCRLYDERLRAAGTKSVWINETGLVHGHLRARYTVSRAAEAFDTLVDVISMLADGRWQFDRSNNREE